MGFDKIKIAIGTKDGIKISPTHLGDSEYFYVYELFEDKRYNLIEKVKNPCYGKNEHASKDKMEAILKLLKGLEILVAKKLSPNFKKISKEKPIQPIVIDRDEISEIIDIIYSNWAQIYSLIKARREGKRAETIPQF